MLFFSLKHTVSFCYGRFRFFGSHFAGIARYRFLALVFLWALGLVQVLNAEWTDSDAQKLVEIINRLDQVNQSVENIPNPNNLLSEINQAVSGGNSHLGIGKLVSIQEDFHHTFLNRLGFTGSGENLSGRLLSIQNVLSNIETNGDDVFNALGYSGTLNLRSDMTKVVNRLTDIKKALSSGSSGGVTYDDLLQLFLQQFGSTIGGGSVYVNYWRASSSGFSPYQQSVRGFPTLFQLLNEQLVEVAKYNEYAIKGFSNMVYSYIKDNPDNLERIIELLEEISSKSGGGSSGGGSSIDYSSALSDILQQLKDISIAVSAISSGGASDYSEILENLRSTVETMASSFGWSQYETEKQFWKSLLAIDSIDIRQLTYKSTKTPQDITFFWTFDKQEKKPVSSLADFLTVFSANQNEGFIRLNRNIASLGEMNYWATTNIVSAINPGAYWGDPSEDLSQMETNKQFVVSVSSSGSSSTPAQSYEPVSTNDLGVIGVQISANTNKLYEVRSDEVASKYLRNPFGEASSSDSIGSVSSSGYEVLSIGGVEMHMEDAYNSFKTNFLDRVAPPLKTGFGALWVFLSVLFASIAIRKCVSGGV